MIAFASLAVAIALSQAAAPPEASPPPAAPEAPEAIVTPRAEPEPRATTPTPTPTAAESSTAPATKAPARPPKSAPAPRSPAPVARPPAATPTPAAATNVAANGTSSERVEVARVALAFLDALLAYDASRLAAVSAQRFSFDGDVRTGRDEVLRTWRDVLGRRDRAPAKLLDLEVLPAPDAVARLGAPPARVASLAAKGTWVTIANVSGRAVVLFLARDGGQLAVTGIHD